MPNEPFKYDVRHPEVEKILQDVGHKIGDSLPPGYGMALFIFGYENHEIFYISSAERAGLIAALREFISKFEEN